MERCIEVFPNPEQLKLAAARHWITKTTAAIDRANVCHIALAGGSTPKMLYQLLAQADYRERIDWQRVHLYFGDERHVPHDDEQSNYRMARDALIDAVAIPPQQVHAVPYLPDATSAAAAYAETLLKHLPLNNGFPRFDIIWLGMGDDGHTASLFPGTELLNETVRFYTAGYVEKLSSWRTSLTFPVINNANNVFMLISGAAKAQRMSEVLLSKEKKYPVQRVKPQGNLCWLLDTDAAAAIEWNMLDAQWMVQR